MASLYASLSAMSLLFQDSRTNINAQNKYGETPLHLCAGSGDKGATKAAKLLLEKGASLTILDKWGRGPKDVSHDNAENPLVTTFQDYLSNNESVKQQVEKNTNAYMKASRTPVNGDEANRLAKTAIFGGIGKGLAGLKKTKTSEKTMFAKSEGLTFSSLKVGDNVKTTTGPSDGRKALSKLVDFPGDLELIKTQLLDLSNVDPAGADSYGLTALHKFASWNKTLLLEVLLPHLTSEDLMRTDPAGKTALHWAVEMASVASVKALVAAGVDVEAKDGKGYTVRDVLDNVEMTGVIQRLKDALVLPKLVKQEA